MITNNEKSMRFNINLGSSKDIKELIEKTEDGMYETTSDSNENVVVYIKQNKGMDVHFYQKKWLD